MLEAAVLMYREEINGICLLRNYSAKKKAATDDEITWGRNNNKATTRYELCWHIYKEKDKRCVYLNNLFVKQEDYNLSTLHKQVIKIIVIPGKWSLLLPMSSYSGLDSYQCKLLQIGISELCQQNFEQNKQMKVLNIKLAEYAMWY